MKRLCLALLALAACERSAAEYGGELFRDTGAFSRSNRNNFACSDCHAVGDADQRILPGYDLAGVAARESWWGGNTLTMADAVDACVQYFMLGNPLDRESEKARALYEYLLSITPDGSPSDPLPMTVVEGVEPLAGGDATRGADLYARACGYCHGDAHTGKGHILREDYILPEEAVSDYAMNFPGTPPGLLFIDATRHGRFFGVGNTMPFFSTEQLSDEALADILAYLGVESE